MVLCRYYYECWNMTMPYASIKKWNDDLSWNRMAAASEIAREGLDVSRLVMVIIMLCYVITALRKRSRKAREVFPAQRAIES